MAFLNKVQVGELIVKIKRLFSRQKQKVVRKKKDRIFYALEPKTGFVHILTESMKSKVLELLAQESRELKKLVGGDVFREIPMKSLRDWSLAIDETYKNVKNWGSGYGLKFNAFFSRGKIFFKLTDNASEESELTLPDLAEGDIFTNRKVFLEKVSSNFNIDDYIKSLGIPVDPEFMSLFIREFQAQLKTTINKLCPPEKGIAL